MKNLYIADASYFMMEYIKIVFVLFIQNEQYGENNTAQECLNMKHTV